MGLYLLARRAAGGVLDQQALYKVYDLGTRVRKDTTVFRGNAAVESAAGRGEKTSRDALCFGGNLRSFVTMFANVSCIVGPEKGVWPNVISYNRTPKDQKSTAADAPQPSTTSGDTYLLKMSTKMYNGTAEGTAVLLQTLNP